MQWRVGQQVLFRHLGDIPAEILEFNAETEMVCLRVEGWLGRQWVPVSKVRRAP